MERQGRVKSGWDGLYYSARKAITLSRAADSAILRSADHPNRSILANPNRGKKRSTLWFLTNEGSKIIPPSNRILGTSETRDIGAIGLSLVMPPRKAGIVGWLSSIGAMPVQIDLHFGFERSAESGLYVRTQPTNTADFAITLQTFGVMFEPERKDILAVTEWIGDQASVLTDARYRRSMSED